jgi:hypothetical protein
MDQATMTAAASAAYLSRLVPEVRWVLRGVKRTKAWAAYLVRSGLVQRHEVDVREVPVLRSIRIASNPLSFGVTVKGPMSEDEARKLTVLYNQWSGRSGGGDE